MYECLLKNVYSPLEWSGIFCTVEEATVSIRDVDFVFRKDLLIDDYLSSSFHRCVVLS